ncbi:MAG: avidin/streptavidin family protein [Candidatus Thiodiazotropha endolucinida]
MSEWYMWKTEGQKVAKPTVNFDGTWENKLGSEMTISVSDGAVTGTYRTAVGAPGDYEEFPITGFANGDLISFVVDWGEYGSITAWVGQQTADDGGGNERIETMWHLAKNIAEKSEKSSLWGSFLTGPNVFTRK